MMKNRKEASKGSRSAELCADPVHLLPPTPAAVGDALLRKEGCRKLQLRDNHLPEQGKSIGIDR